MMGDVQLSATDVGGDELSDRCVDGKSLVGEHVGESY